MSKYILLGIDQMEASIVRRRLQRWNTDLEKMPRAIAAFQKDTITPVIAALQEARSLLYVSIREPRWETNVCPLYYYWSHRHRASHREVYKRVIESLPRPVPPDLQKQLVRAADTEIDILVEDLDYFVFLEVKIPARNGKVKFERTGNVHQLVRQYIQGRILKRHIPKAFGLATIGANNGEAIRLDLNDTEKMLVDAVDEDGEFPEIVDLPLTLLDAIPSAATPC